MNFEEKHVLFTSFSRFVPSVKTSTLGFHKHRLKKRLTCCHNLTLFTCGGDGAAELAACSGPPGAELRRTKGPAS